MSTKKHREDKTGPEGTNSMSINLVHIKVDNISQTSLSLQNTYTRNELYVII